jgi:hypothetical protein
LEADEQRAGQHVAPQHRAEHLLGLHAAPDDPFRQVARVGPYTVARAMPAAAATSAMLACCRGSASTVAAASRIAALT